MNEIVYIFFSASVAVCIFAIVTFFVVVSYHKALRRQRQLEEEVNKLKLEGSDQVNKILLDAQTEATHIIKNAQIKSHEFINASEVFSKEFREKFQQIILRNSEVIFQGASKDIGLELKRATEAFSSSLGEHMKAAMSSVQSELEEYKKAKMDELSAKVSQLVRETAKNALGQSLDEQQHTKAIITALEEAKKQNVL